MKSSKTYCERYRYINFIIIITIVKGMKLWWLTMNLIYYLPHTPGSCFHVNVLVVVLMKKIASEFRVSDIHGYRDWYWNSVCMNLWTLCTYGWMQDFLTSEWLDEFYSNSTFKSWNILDRCQVDINNSASKTGLYIVPPKPKTGIYLKNGFNVFLPNVGNVLKALHKWNRINGSIRN